MIVRGLVCWRAGIMDANRTIITREAMVEAAKKMPGVPVLNRYRTDDIPVGLALGAEVDPGGRLVVSLNVRDEAVAVGLKGRVLAVRPCLSKTHRKTSTTLGGAAIVEDLIVESLGTMLSTEAEEIPGGEGPVEAPPVATQEDRVRSAMLERLVREALARAPQGTSVGGDWLLALASAVWESAQDGMVAAGADSALVGALAVVRMRTMDATIDDARPSEVRRLTEYLRETVDEALRGAGVDPLKAGLMAHGYLSRKRPGTPEPEPVADDRHQGGEST